MERKIISEETVTKFQAYLIREERSPATIEKYMREVRAFTDYSGDREITKETVLAYRSSLTERYAVPSVNAKLAAVGSLFRFLGWEDCRVKSLKRQRQVFAAEERELTRAEYLRLLTAAEGNPRLRLILETICSTGIRVSELPYFTVEAVKRGTVIVRCKNKTRNIIIPGKLKTLLLKFAKKQRITGGILFRTRTGKPISRGNIWAEMKKLCVSARVDPRKVFPHNLRHLFARTFYGLERDIARLADVLGHSSIDTTRIYIMTTGTEHRRQLERMGLVI